MTEPPGRSPEARVNGFLDAVGRLVVAGLEMAHTRLELVFLELQEGLEGLVGVVLWLLTALFAAGLGLVFGGLTLIFVFWDSHRVLVTADHERVPAAGCGGRQGGAGKAARAAQPVRHHADRTG
jgi:uncharacterized membrane protein YqjE